MNPSHKTILILTIVFFFLGGAFILVGAVAKLQHWSWAGPCLIGGITMQFLSYLLGAALLLLYITRKRKHTEPNP